MPSLRIGLAQLNTVVGDIDGNASRIIELMDQANAAGCDIVAFPELAITGYPPEDLLLRSGFVDDVRAALDRIIAASSSCTTVVGFVEQGLASRESADPGEVTKTSRAVEGPVLFNAAAVLSNGSLDGVYRKRELPNYSVFDEARYFVAGEGPVPVFEVQGVRFGVSICEDAWIEGGPIAELGSRSVQLVVNINASPFNVGKSQERAAVVAERAREAAAPIAYVNQVGGQDELVFDGDSMVMSANGVLLARASRFVEELCVVDVDLNDANLAAERPRIDQGTYYQTKDRYHLAIQGQYEYTVGGESVIVKPGTLLWFNNKLMHGTQNVGDCTRITFVFDVPHNKKNP